MDDKSVTLSIDIETKKLLAEKGFDEVYGARELGRVIQDQIKKPLAEELIFGTIANGGHVDITLKKGQINFKFSSKQKRNKEFA